MVIRNMGKHKVSWLICGLVTVFLVSGCGSDASEPEGNGPEISTSRETSDYPVDMGEDIQEPPSGDLPQDGDDLGEACDKHVYVVAAGGSASLAFQVLLKREVLDLEEYNKQRFQVEDVSIKDSLNYWDKMGVERGEPEFFLEPLGTSVDLWGVRAEELLEKYADEAGKLVEIGQSSRSNYTYKIKIHQEGFGLFSILGKWRGEQRIAELNEDEVYELLGSKMEIEHIHQKFGKTVLPVEIISVDAESYILTVTYDLTFPEDLKTATKGTELWQVVHIKDRTDAKFCLRFSYNKNRRMFFVSGPWFASQCL